MPESIQPLYQWLQACCQQQDEKPKRGRPLVHNHIPMLLFFITMALKRIHAFKAIADYAKVHYRRFGFTKPPSRKTLRRRFLALPAFLPSLAQEAVMLDVRFGFRTTFADESLDKAWYNR